jgi:hypothetical protein
MDLIVKAGAVYPRRAAPVVDITSMNPFPWGGYWWYYDSRANVFGPFQYKRDAEHRGTVPRKTPWQRLKAVLRRWSNGC